MIHLPTALYEQLQLRATRRQRLVADEVLDVLMGATPATEELPADLELAIDQLRYVDETALWQAGRSRLSTEAAERLQSLNRKRQ